MATKREKQLAITLLKERLERLTGKKVILKEDFYDSDAAERQRKQKLIDSIFSPIDDDYANRVETAIKNDWFEELGKDPDEFIMTGISAFMDDNEAKWFVSFYNEDHFHLKHAKSPEHMVHPFTKKPLKSKYFELIVVPGRNEPWPISVEMSSHGYPANAKSVWSSEEFE